jgi:HD-like signal output (HDOD) protein/CheY-like chemotaxis protein
VRGRAPAAGGSMTRLLLVDDEPNVVQGLSRMMRSVRDEWDVKTALSGLEALEVMAEWRADVVVSDMRMPGMNGVELLNKIAALYPDAVRLILSGHTDREVIMQSAIVAHQFLAKPCDAQTLVNTLRRAASVRALLNEPAIRNVVGRTMSLPCLSSTYDALMRVLGQEGCTANDVAKVVACDMVLTAKVMQLVNSAFFGTPRRVDNVVEAVSCLGIDVVRGLVATVEVFDGFEGVLDETCMIDLFNHSLRVGSLCRELAIAEGMTVRDQEDALLAGMLHDIGKLVLARAYPTEYKAILGTGDEWWPSRDAQRQKLGVSHSEVGAYLLGLWGFQIHIVEAVAYHDRPSACEVPIFSLTTLVHSANALVCSSHGSEAHAPAEIDREYLATVGKLEAFDGWMALQQEVPRAA